MPDGIGREPGRVLGAEGPGFAGAALEGAAALLLCLLSFAYLSNAAFNPFIYFRF